MAEQFNGKPLSEVCADYIGNSLAEVLSRCSEPSCGGKATSAHRCGDGARLPLCGLHMEQHVVAEIRAQLIGRLEAMFRPEAEA